MTTSGPGTHLGMHLCYSKAASELPEISVADGKSLVITSGVHTSDSISETETHSYETWIHAVSLMELMVPTLHHEFH